MSRRLGALLATAVALVLAFTGSRYATLAVARPIAPDADRSPVEWLEEQLYTPAPLSTNEQRSLAQAFQSLATALDGRNRPPLAHDAARKLRDLSRRTADTPAMGANELAGIRARWVVIRSRLFTPAPWFLDAEMQAGSDAPPPLGALPLADLQQSARLSRAASGFELLAMRMQGDLRNTSDAAGQDEFIATRNAASGGWGRWAENWDGQLATDALDEPAPIGSEYRPELRYARDEIDASAAELHAIVTGARTTGLAPRPSDWRPHVEAARTHARNARRATALVRRAHFAR